MHRGAFPDCIGAATLAEWERPLTRVIGTTPCPKITWIDPPGGARCEGVGMKGAPIMALVPCSACKRRTLGKLIAVYTARFSEQRRVAFKTRLCYDCAAEFAETVKLAKPVRADERGQDWPEFCPLCGGGTAEDLDPIYLTVYEPKQDGRSLTIATCASCTANLAPQLEQHGERLVDRQPGSPDVTRLPQVAGEGAPSPLAWA